MPMREIAEKIGRTKERVRQILMEGCGSTDHEYLSTLQLCKQDHRFVYGWNNCSGREMGCRAP
jgi:hypothetical protein